MEKSLLADRVRLGAVDGLPALVNEISRGETGFIRPV
jgi:hypothetical protein